MQENTDTNAIATTGNNSLAQTGAGDLAISTGAGFVPQTREQFELLRELQEAEAQIEALGLVRLRSDELAANGAVFAVVDAWLMTIPDKKTKEPKQIVAFKIESAEYDNAVVLKDANSININYAEYFSKFKAIGQPRRLENYCFVELANTGQINNPIVLRPAPKQVKNVTNKAK